MGVLFGCCLVVVWLSGVGVLFGCLFGCYDGGHLIGTLFQSPTEKINLVSQLKGQNRYGEWREMEKNWAKELDKDNKVEIEILAEYDGDDTTPKSLHATSIVDEVRQQPQHIDN